MRTKPEIISLLTNPGIIAIVRTQQPAQVLPLFEALIAGGVRAIEITMTTPNALAAIREAREKLGERALVGVGTVLDADTCRAALAAGAEFVVSPIGRAELVPIAHAAGCPIMLGAYTPTEAQLAHEAGADFVKLFPADTLGPNYIKALLAPLPAPSHRAHRRRGRAHRRRLPEGRLRRPRRRFLAGLRQDPPGSRLARADPPRHCPRQRRPPSPPQRLSAPGHNYSRRMERGRFLRREAFGVRAACCRYR